MKGVTVVEHPLVQHYLTQVRDERTDLAEFRRSVGQLGVFLVYEATRSLKTKSITVETPLASARGNIVANQVVLVPILRAGLGLLDTVLEFIPRARVGFIGLSRHEETLQASKYHSSLMADLKGAEVVVLDPMLATGGSAVAALEMIFERGARQVRLVNLVASPEGIRTVQKRFPKLPIFVAAIDRRLNEKGYIVPGLGDAGCRLFGV